MHGLILREGYRLSPNENKAEVYGADEWRKEIETAPIEGNDFYNYCRHLEGWIKSNLGSIDVVKRNLRDEGFHIPI